MAGTTTSSPLSNTDSIDTRINETRMREFSDVMMAQSDGTYKPPVEEITRIADDKTYAGYGINDIVEMDNLFTQHIQKYLNETNNIIMMNDVVTSNEYLNTTMDTEFQRVAQLTDKTRNTIYKTRSSYMLKKYQIAYNKFISGILQFTLFVAILLIACLAAWRQGLEIPENAKKALWQSPTLLISCASVLVVFYLFIVILLFKKYQSRRKDDWDKYYFSTMEKGGNTNEGICLSWAVIGLMVFVAIVLFIVWVSSSSSSSSPP